MDPLTYALSAFHDIFAVVQQTSTVQQVSADVHLSVRKTSCSISSVAQKRQALCSGPLPSGANDEQPKPLHVHLHQVFSWQFSAVTACVYVYVDAQHLFFSFKSTAVVEASDKQQLLVNIRPMRPAAQTLFSW